MAMLNNQMVYTAIKWVYWGISILSLSKWVQVTPKLWERRASVKAKKLRKIADLGISTPLVHHVPCKPLKPLKSYPVDVSHEATHPMKIPLIPWLRANFGHAKIHPRALTQDQPRYISPKLYMAFVSPACAAWSRNCAADNSSFLMPSPQENCIIIT